MHVNELLPFDEIMMTALTMTTAGQRLVHNDVDDDDGDDVDDDDGNDDDDDDDDDGGERI